MIPKEERLKLLDEFIDKFNGMYNPLSKDILLDAVSFLQTLLEFSFRIEKYDRVPKIVLGEEKDEEDNTKTKIYEKPLIFLKLLKRCYAPIDDPSKSLFGKKDILLASFPVMWTSCEGEYTKPDGTIDKYPYKQGVFHTDNEFLITLKTKTLAEQYKVLNLLEKALNIYSKNLYGYNIIACGIARIESKELKDKDDLKTANIYFQIRLKEVVNFDNTYLLKAFYIFNGKEDIFEIDGSGDNFTTTIKTGKFPECNITDELDETENNTNIEIYTF